MDSIRSGSKTDLQTSNRVYVTLPLEEAHTGHHITAESGMCNAMHPAIRHKIKELVSNGISTVPLIKPLLRMFVKEELSMEGAAVPPDRADRAYYPTS